MYSVICEFLLLKPYIDLKDIPEFYKLFFSSKFEPAALTVSMNVIMVT